jgi:hypothetical protein
MLFFGCLFSLQCVFCDKTYKDKQTLKDHMRKKQHKKINPKNKEFDKYYLINYLVCRLGHVKTEYDIPSKIEKIVVQFSD